MTETIYTKIPTDLKNQISQMASDGKQSISELCTGLIESGLEVEEYKKLVSQLREKLEEYEGGETELKAEEESIEEKESESEPQKPMGILTVQKPIDLTDHNAMLRAGLSWCPSCGLELKTNKSLQTLFNENMRRVWNERMNLDAICSRCGFPLKVHGKHSLFGRESEFTEETEDQACPICGNTHARERFERGVGDFKLVEKD